MTYTSPLHEPAAGDASAAGWDTRPIWRVAFVAMLAWSMGMAVMPTHAVAVFAPEIMDRLGISRGQLGTLPSAMFVSAALASFVAGRLSDRLGGRASLCMLWLIVTFGIVVIATAPNPVIMMAGFFIVGTGAASSNPATNHLVSRHVPTRRRGMAMGLKQAGVPLAGTVVGLVVPGLGTVFGWRVAVLALAMLSIAGLVVTLLLVPVDAAASEARQAAPLPGKVKLSPHVRSLALYALIMGTGMAVFTAYLPLYAQERLGASVGEAGAIVGFSGLVGVASRLLWGNITDRAAELSRPLAALAAGSVVSAALMLAAPHVGRPLVWVGAAIYGATAVSWNAVGMTSIVRSAGAAATGRSTGAVMTGFYTGYVVGPSLAGASLELTDSYVTAWTGAAVMFAVGVVVALKSRSAPAVLVAEA